MTPFSGALSPLPAPRIHNNSFFPKSRRGQKDESIELLSKEKSGRAKAQELSRPLSHDFMSCLMLSKSYPFAARATDNNERTSPPKASQCQQLQVEPDIPSTTTSARQHQTMRGKKNGKETSDVTNEDITRFGDRLKKNQVFSFQEGDSQKPAQPPGPCCREKKAAHARDAVKRSTSSNGLSSVCAQLV